MYPPPDQNQKAKYVIEYPNAMYPPPDQNQTAKYVI